MSIWHIAWQNVRHQARNYAAFFLSATFAVWVFFLYSALLFHPGVVGPTFPEGMRTILTIIEMIVVLFAVVFILYAHSAFQKARLREIATMQMVGVAPGQITRLLAAELLLMGAGAIGLGIGFGLAFLQFFLLLISRVLRLTEPIPFHLSWAAVGLTAGAFVAIYLVIGLLSRRFIRRAAIAELFQAASRPKEPPTFSPWLAGAGGISLLLSYGMALSVQQEEFVDRFLPILALLTVGTYLLFTQGAVAIMRWLKRRRALYLRRTNLLTIAQFTYKVKENARVLFLITMLSTISLTILGLLFNIYLSTEQEALKSQPVHLEVVDAPGGITRERVTAILQDHGVDVATAVETPSISAVTLAFRDPAISFRNQAVHRILPLSAANRWLQAHGEDPISLQPGEAAYLLDREYRYLPSVRASQSPVADLVSDISGERMAEVQVRQVLVRNLFNQNALLVLHDDHFRQIAAVAATQMVHLYQFTNWRAAVDAVVGIRQAYPGTLDDGRPAVSGTGIFQHQQLQAGGFMLFLGCFVGLLFFLGSCNLLYFKLLNDLLEERPQFRALARVGIRPAEVRRVVSTQTMVLFFAPLALAVSNAAVAVRMFGRFEVAVTWQPMALVSLLYALLFGAYYLITRQTYVRALLRHA